MDKYAEKAVVFAAPYQKLVAEALIASGNPHAKDAGEALGKADTMVVVQGTACVLVLLITLLHLLFKKNPYTKAGIKKRLGLLNATPGQVVVTQILKYPVKGMRPIIGAASGTLDTLDLLTLEVDEHGFKNDREWLVVKMFDAPKKGADAEFMTTKEVPELLAFQPTFSEAGNLTLTYVPHGEFFFSLTKADKNEKLTKDDTTVEILPSHVKAGKKVKVFTWTKLVTGIDQGDAVAKLLCKWLGGPGYRLLRMEPGTKYWAFPEVTTDSAKWGTFTMCSERSMKWLNDHPADGKKRDMLNQKGVLPRQIQRFAPNIVIDGEEGVNFPAHLPVADDFFCEALEAFDEETWAKLKIGEVEMTNLQNVGRDAITNLMPEHNGRMDDTGEPLNTLERYRVSSHPFLDKSSEHYKPEPFFGCSLRHAFKPGQVIKVGDVVTVSETKDHYPSKKSWPKMGSKPK